MHMNMNRSLERDKVDFFVRRARYVSQVARQPISCNGKKREVQSVDLTIVRLYVYTSFGDRHLTRLPK